MGISPYLARLRESVGHQMLQLPAVAVLVWDQHKRLLLVREADSGRWQTVGGAIEPDEAPEQAALREAEEEAGVVVALDRLRGVAGGPDFRILYANGDEVSYVSIAFDAHVVEGEIKPDGEETTEVAWFTPEQLGSADLTDFTVALLAKLKIAVTRA